MWLYALGALFIVVTLFLPRGLMGLLAPRARPAPAEPEPEPAVGPLECRREVTRMSRSPTRLLYLDGVSVSFDGFRALNELSLAIEPGEMRAVIGPNGAGKTTMMDVITGKTRPDTGQVVFGDDTDLTRLDEPAIAALGIGRKFQKPTVFESHSVWDNLLLALAGGRTPRFTLFARQSADERRRIEDILATIRLADHRHRLAAELSHGQKQWLEIGMLLAQEPRLLLLDEPVAGMSDAETEQTAELLRDINRTRSIVVVEHDMAFVRALDVRVTVLHEGSVLSEGSIDSCQRRSRALSKSISGAERNAGDDAASRSIDLHYGAAIALRQVSIAAEAGPVTALLGRNGVGKTSLLRAIVGAHPISRGSIRWDGAEITSLADIRPGAARHRAGCRRAATSFRC